MTLIKRKCAMALAMALVMAFTAFVALPVPVSAATTTYYVHAVTGDDSTGDGTNGSPFKTLNAAITAAYSDGDNEGDIIKLLSDYTIDPLYDFYIFPTLSLDIGANTLALGTCSLSMSSRAVLHVASGGSITGSGSVNISSLLLNFGTITAPVQRSSGGVVYTKDDIGDGSVFAADTIYGGDIGDNPFPQSGEIAFDAQGNISIPSWLGQYFIVTEIDTGGGSGFQSINSFSPGSYNGSDLRLGLKPTFGISTAPFEFTSGLDFITLTAPNTPPPIEPPRAPVPSGDVVSSGESERQIEYYGLSYYIPDGDGWKLWHTEGGFAAGSYATITSRKLAGLLYWTTDKRGLGPRYYAGDPYLMNIDIELYATLEPAQQDDQDLEPEDLDDYGDEAANTNLNPGTGR